MYNKDISIFNLKLKPRILIVDNDPIARIASQSLLLDCGYDPILARGEGDRLIADAKEKARDERCTLALIDMRLYDDGDNEDNSGLKLASDLSERAQCIILSGYGDQQALIKIIQSHKNLNFILKTNSPDSIVYAIDMEAKKVSAAKRGLKLENLNVLDEISHTVLGSLTKQYPDQIVDLLARLFPGANRLRIERMDTHPSLVNISTAPRPTSMILKVYEPKYDEPYIVKIARPEKIQKEVDRYNQFIYRNITERFTARLIRNEILWDIGGASYSYPGDYDVTTFSRFYEEKTISDIEESLKFLFNDVWSRHYLKAYDKPNVSLFNLYTEVWGEWYEKCIKAFPVTKPLDISFATKELNTPDPILWLKIKIVENPNDESLMGNTRIAVTHGDLHGDNLLVDSKNDAWVIDFERCGKGHALQDFIELEADIVHRLGAHSLNPFEYIKMSIFILGHKKIRSFEDIEMIAVSENKHIKKALHTISILRSLAVKHTGIVDAREYVLGLLFNTIFRATIAHYKYPHKGPHQVLMLASIICHRLDHWDDPWPPLEWWQLLK